tara:strand:- start:1025 stop:4633 length:3609 start_codon:yes stop_codon:yes gene_type:complete
MGQFKGNIISQESSFHTVLFRHALMEEYGLCNLNLPTLKHLSTSRKRRYRQLLNIQDITSASTMFDWLSAKWGITSFTYRAAGDDGYSSKTISVERLASLIEFHDKSIERQEEDSNASSYRLDIANIQHSRDGCAKSNVATESSEFALEQMGFSFDYHVEIWFNNRNAQSNDRSLGNKTTNQFVGTPRRNSGALWSPGKSDGEEAGVFVGDGLGEDGTSDPNDQIAGPLLTVWNDNLGGFQTPGTFLARLLEDIPSADIPLIALDSSTTSNREPTEFLEGANNSSNAQFGLAAPFNVHKNNPRAFAPNFNKCDEQTNVEKIQVVNRSNVNFSVGEVVLVYPIDGEFIIGKYSPTTEEEIPFQQGRTGFYQYIANSDELFRPIVDGETGQKNTKYILPDDFLNMVRYRYYGGEGSNALAEDAIPEWQKTAKINPYCQLGWSNVPQTSPSGLINTFSNPNGAEIGIDGTSEQIPLWWGPVYVEGVTANTGWGSAISGITVDAHSYKADINKTRPLPQINQFDGLNFPAMRAFIGPYGDGFPVEDTYGFVKSFNAAQGSSTRTSFSTYNESYYVAISGEGSFNKFNSAYNLSVANPNNICFQLCQAEYIGACDDGSEEAVMSSDAPGVLQPTDLMCRKLKESARKFWNATGPILDFGSAILKIRGAIATRAAAFSDGYGDISDFGTRVQRDIAGNTTGNHYFYNKNADPGSFECFPYDAYVRYKALNKPRDTNQLWGGDGAVGQTISSQSYIGSRIGSNAVGISVMRRKFSGGGKNGATISVDANGLYGVRGRSFGLAPRTDWSVSIIGSFFMGGIGNTTADTRGLTSAFGSTTGDSFYGFGSAGAFIRVYDGWPDQDTVAVPQYFTLLHFNPSTFYGVNNDNELKTSFTSVSPDVGSNRTSVNQALKEVRFYTDSDSYSDKTIAIDIPDPVMPEWLKEKGSTHHLDFYEPVYGGYIEIDDPDGDGEIRLRSNTGSEGDAVPVGTYITSGTYLRPKDEWKLNTSRRGQLVSDAGFTYSQMHIGASKEESSILRGGSGFAKGDEYNLRNDVIVEITSVSDGSVTGWKFKETIFNGSNGDSVTNVERGSNFSPGDFPLSLIFTSKGGGDVCDIYIKKGYTYYRQGIDVGPKTLAGPTRLTLGSGEGKTWIEGLRSSSISVSPTPGIRYLGSYEAVFFVQNDVGMATMNQQNSTSGTNRLQFFQLNIA